MSRDLWECADDVFHLSSPGDNLLLQMQDSLAGNDQVNAAGAFGFVFRTGVAARSRSTPGYLAGPRGCGFGAVVLRSIDLILTHSGNDCKY